MTRKNSLAYQRTALALLFALGCTAVVRAEELKYDFQGGWFDGQLFRYDGPKPIDFVKPESDGLTWRFAAGKTPRSPVGIRWQQQARGDFTFTAHYEIDRVDPPVKGSGVGPELYLILGTPEKNGIALARVLRPNGSSWFQFTHLANTVTGARVVRETNQVPTDGESLRGRLQFARRGSQLTASFAPGDSLEFQELHRTAIGRADVLALRIAAVTGSVSDASLSMRLLGSQLEGRDLAVNGRFTTAPPPADESVPPVHVAVLPGESASPGFHRIAWGLLAITAIGGLAGGWFVMRRRMAPPRIPTTGSARAEPATEIRFACTQCRHMIRVKETLAGKRVKCPSCAEAARVPSAEVLGFTLIELMVALVIIAILIGLCIPGVQIVRERANSAHCMNNLKQIGLAFQSHHTAHGYFPTAGNNWGSPPTFQHGTPAIGSKQGAGWGYQILPYLEAADVWRGGDAATDSARQRLIVGFPHAIFFCPSRRPPSTVTYADFYLSKGPADPVVHALCDYAANNLDDDTGAIRANWFGPPVRIGEVTDGTSSTLLVGEKRMNRFYFGLKRSDDNEGYSSGNDWDTMRNANDAPAPDTSARTGEQGFSQFGAAHGAGFHVVLADGSVRPIAYSIDASVFSRLGSRADGEPVGAQDF